MRYPKLALLAVASVILTVLMGLAGCSDRDHDRDRYRDDRVEHHER
jgi:hypothetical protein